LNKRIKMLLRHFRRSNPPFHCCKRRLFHACSGLFIGITVLASKNGEDSCANSQEASAVFVYRADRHVYVAGSVGLSPRQANFVAFLRVSNLFDIFLYPLFRLE
jgi:hypothetical protein